MRSLEARLHFGLAITLALLLLVFWRVGYETLRGGTEALVRNRLQQDAEALIGLLASASDPASLEPIPRYRQPYSGHYYVLLNPTGDPILSRSLWDSELEVSPLAVGESAVWEASGPEGQRLLVWAHGYRDRGRDFTLAVAEDLAHLDEILAEFERRLALMGLIGFLVLVLVQHVTVFHAFLRLRPVYADIERLERGETDQLTEQVPDEILPLVRQFNRLLNTLAQRLERSRRGVADLAHALKSPLTLLRRLLEVPVPAAEVSHHDQIAEQVERMRHLMERELRRARLAGPGTPGRSFNPAEEMPVLVRLLKQMHPTRPLYIEWQAATEGLLAVDREDLLELLGVLLDNACKWAESRVLCTLAPAPRGMVVRVEDDGPGCLDEALDRIRRRGARLDEQVDGHGLGLSIASDIVKLYGGGLILGRSPHLGGFLAEAHLLRTVVH